MKKDKEWLKKETEKIYKHDEAYLNPDDIVVENYQTVTSILELIDQLDEPEQVVIPQFVVDFIEEAKENDWTIRDVFYQIIKGGLVNLDADEWIENNPDAFAQVWATGECTIEQPKLLTVIVKDYDKTIMSKQLPENEVKKMMREW